MFIECLLYPWHLLALSHLPLKLIYPSRSIAIETLNFPQITGPHSNGQRLRKTQIIKVDQTECCPETPF